MERTNEISRFIEFESGKNMIIEPSGRFIHVRDRLMDVVKTYNPRVIVKAGVGEGGLLLALAESTDSYIVVVDYSMDAITRFRQQHRDSAALEKIYFIVGSFENFPVDYYAADLLVSVDYFDFIETGAAVDEFRRSLQFEGILFISAEVLHDEDLDGVYDEFIASLFPLHNDMYLQADLKTFLTLNEFKFIKGDVASFPVDVDGLISHYAGFSTIDTEQAAGLLSEHRESFEALYSLKDRKMNVPYYIGVFMREKLK